MHTKTLSRDVSAPTTEELFERLDALLPGIAARAEKVDVERQIPEETISELKEIGIFRMLTPRYWGGYGMDLMDFQEVARRLARSCASTAWVVGYLTQHAWLLARWPMELQEEVFTTPDPLSAVTNAGAGKLTPVDGGYRLTGKWSFASGIMQADWVGCGVIDDDGELKMALLPVEDVEIIDVWHTAGLRGTASNDVRIEDVFVPQHRVCSWTEFGAIDNPGALVHPEPNLRAAISSFFNNLTPAIVLGSVERAAELFKELMLNRKVKHGIEDRQADSPIAQARYAAAMSELQAAELLWREGHRLSQKAYMESRIFEDDERARFRLALLYSGEASTRALELITLGSGAGQQRLGAPLQRIQRDFHILRSHATLVPDPILEQAGRGLLGLGFTIPKELF